MNKDIVIGIICVVASEILFGFSYYITKVSTSAISPITLISWRFLVAFFVLILLRLTRRIKINIKNKPKKQLLTMLIFNPLLYYMGETFGIRYTTSSESGCIIASIPVVALIASSILLKEKPSKNQLLGIITTILGVFTIVLSLGLSLSFSPLGYIMLMLAVISYSLFCVYSQKSHQYTSIEKTYLMIGFGSVFFTVWAIISSVKEHRLSQYFNLPFNDVALFFGILYLGIFSTVATYFLVNISINKIGTNRTASFVGISTLIGVISGIVLLNESFTIFQLIGSILILAGVYIANYKIDSKEASIQIGQ
jgi:drug/metabolite transporter (DMT)-like permease